MDLEEKTAKHTRHLLLAARLGASLAALSVFHRGESMIFSSFHERMRGFTTCLSCDPFGLQVKSQQRNLAKRLRVKRNSFRLFTSSSMSCRLTFFFSHGVLIILASGALGWQAAAGFVTLLGAWSCGNLFIMVSGQVNIDQHLVYFGTG